MSEMLEEKKAPAGGPPPPVVEELLRMPDLSGLTACQAADKFLDSEEFYVERGLRVVTETFEQRLKNHIVVDKAVISEAEIAQIFLNISNIYDFNRGLLTELRKLRLDTGGDQNLLDNLGAIMRRHIPFFKLYTSYIKNHRRAVGFLAELEHKKKSFAEFLELNKLCAGTSLTSLLGVPVSRLPQYLIFLGSIAQIMPDPDSPSAAELNAAINAIQQVTDDIAFALRDEAARKLVVTVQERIFKGGLDLVSPARFVCKHGDLKIVNPKSIFGSRFSVYIFILFNDFLLIGTRPGTLSSGKAKHVLRLDGMTVSEEANADDYKNAFRIRSALDDQNHLVCGPNPQVKKAWMDAINESIAAQLKTLASGKTTMSSKDFADKITKKTSTAPAKMVARPATAAPTVTISATSIHAPRTPVATVASPTATSSSSSSSSSSGAGAASPRTAAPGPPPPAPAASDPMTRGDWVKMLDESSGDYYYENTKTGETTWDEPEEFKKPPAPARPTRAAPAIPVRGGAASSIPAAPGGPAPTSSIPSAPDAPPMDAPGAPPPPPPPGPGSFGSGGGGPIGGGSGRAAPPPPPSPTPSGGGGGDLLSQIRAGRELKKAAPVAPAKSAGGAGLNDALKTSLDRYRKFVQDDEEEIPENSEADDWS